VPSGKGTAIYLSVYPYAPDFSGLRLPCLSNRDHIMANSQLQGDPPGRRKKQRFARKEAWLQNVLQGVKR